MIELVKVSRVMALDGARLWVLFSNGMEGVRDFADILQEGGPMVEPLRDPQMFSRVFVQCGVPPWPNGFDIDAIQLHMEMKERVRKRGLKLRRLHRHREAALAAAAIQDNPKPSHGLLRGVYPGLRAGARNDVEISGESFSVAMKLERLYKFLEPQLNVVSRFRFST